VGKKTTATLSNREKKGIMEWLKSNPESNVEFIMNKYNVSHHTVMKLVVEDLKAFRVRSSQERR
jgi:putative heme iron utilization protein